MKIFHEGVDLSDRRGVVFNVLWNKGSMTFPLIDAGRWDEALEAAYEIVRWERDMGASQLGLMAGNVMGWVQTQRGDVGEAAEVSAAMLPRAREAEDPQMLWTMLGIASQVALAQGTRSRPRDS